MKLIFSVISLRSKLTLLPKLAALLLFLLMPQTSLAQQWSMGFWWGGDGVTPSTFNGVWRGLTHVIVSGVSPDGSGNLNHYSDSNYNTNWPAMITAAHANGVQTLLNLTDIEAGSNFNGAVNSNLGGFANNVASMVAAYGFDGVDVDWELTLDSASPDTVARFFSALRVALGSKTITADVYSCCGSITSKWLPSLSYLDRINSMTYDGAGTFQPYSWFNSSLYNPPEFQNPFTDAGLSMDMSAKMWEQYTAIPPSKLNMGIPFYGYVSSGAGVHGPRQQWGSSKPSLNQMRYSRILANYPQASTPNWDSASRTPWFSTDDGWVTFDNARSVTEKVNYAKANGLGGWIIFNLAQDYTTAGTTSHPLVAAIQSAMGASAPVPLPAPTPTPSPAPAPTITSNWVYVVSKNSGRCLDVPAYSTSPGSRLIQWDCHSGTNQKFQIVPVESGYKITAMNSGLQLDIAGGPDATQDGTPVIQWPYWGGSNEIFHITATGDGYSTITASSSGKCFDVEGISKRNGAHVNQWSCWGGDNQKWRFVPAQ